MVDSEYVYLMPTEPIMHPAMPQSLHTAVPQHPSGSMRGISLMLSELLAFSSAVWQRMPRANKVNDKIKEVNPRLPKVNPTNFYCTSLAWKVRKILKASSAFQSKQSWRTYFKIGNKINKKRLVNKTKVHKRSCLDTDDNDSRSCLMRCGANQIGIMYEWSPCQAEIKPLKTRGLHSSTAAMLSFLHIFIVNPTYTYQTMRNLIC